MQWSKTKSVWFGTILVLIVVGLIIAVVFVRSKHTAASGISQSNATWSGQNIVTFLGSDQSTATFKEYSDSDIQKWEHEYPQKIWRDTKGQLSPFLLTNGMQFRLVSTTDPSDDKYVGKSFTLTIGAQEYQDHVFPTLLLLKGSSGEYAGIDLISGIDWLNYLTTHEIPSNKVSFALDKSEAWVLKVTSGPQSGKEIPISNYYQFCKLLAFEK